MFRFLETDIREQKSYERRIQTSADNTVNDPRYEIQFENCVKDKSNLFIKRNIAFLFLDKNMFYVRRQDVFFKIPKNLIASTSFFFFFRGKY